MGIDLPGEELEQEGGRVHTQRCCHTLTEPAQSSTTISRNRHHNSPVVQLLLRSSHGSIHVATHYPRVVGSELLQILVCLHFIPILNFSILVTYIFCQVLMIFYVVCRHFSTLT